MAEPDLHSRPDDDVPPAALFRLKAIASEQRARAAHDPVVRQDWEELAIEWRLLAHAAGQPGAARREPHGLSYYVDDLAGAIHAVAQR